MSYGQLYHRGREKIEGVGKAIARFPGKETSGILFLYLILARSGEMVNLRTMRMFTTRECLEDSDVDAEDDWKRVVLLFPLVVALSMKKNTRHSLKMFRRLALV